MKKLEKKCIFAEPEFKNEILASIIPNCRLLFYEFLLLWGYL
jgi:ABC-type Zn2+ transport system substrate-binding protein/surface adhesin